MSSDKHGLNVIEVNGTSMLLTLTSGGGAVHLTAPVTESEAGCGAVPDFYFEREADRKRLAGYHLAALREPRWRETTLCGHAWVIMAGGEGGAVDPWGPAAFAPTCRRCLSIIDRQFPRPAADPRLMLVAQLAADTVVDQRGFAEIDGVPGDQLDQLRKTIRGLIRQRTRHPVRTFVSHGVVHVLCQAIFEQRAEQRRQETNEMIDAAFRGEPPIPRRERDWVISWDAWDIT